MVQVKSFFNETEMNIWLEENDVKFVGVSVHPMHDLYEHNGSICNQWTEYLLVYKLKRKLSAYEKGFFNFWKKRVMK